MSDVNNFQISKGNVRQLSEEEIAFMEGKTIESKAVLTDSTPAEAADGITRMMPDGKGGFKPVSSSRVPAAADRRDTVGDEPAGGSGTPAPVQEQPAGPDEGIIRIRDAKKRVELVCSGKFGDKDGVFIVGMSAVSVDVADEGISVLVRADVDVCPPTLCDMQLKVDNVVYKVLYAGGKHRFGGYINMPFVIV